MVTLVGAAGSGKTRLAVELARRFSAGSADGAYMIELAPLHDPATLPQAFTSALGINAGPTAALTDALREWLAAFDGILLVDNCEHLIDSCAQVVDHLLRTCPMLRVLATSREPLRVDGESVWRVPALSLPPDHATTRQIAQSEAVQLFVERARQVAGDFELPDADYEDVASICRNLDGLPLAVEFAAALMSALSPKAINAQLSDRFTVLTSGYRSAPPRQKTLRAAIDWSFHLLTVPEQRLLTRTSVFAGGFDADAAQAVCSGESVVLSEVPTLLARLIEKSLVVALPGPSDRPRFRLLESLRAYGLEQLREAGELEARRQQHAEYYAALSARVDPPEVVAHFPQMRPQEIDNLREALGWSQVANRSLYLLLASAFGSFCMTSGSMVEGRSWLESAITDAPQDAALASGLLVLAVLTWRQGDIAAAERYASRAISRYRELDYPQRLAHALGNLAFIQIDAQQLDAAEIPLAEELAIVEQLADQGARAEALFHVGWLETHRGQLASARQHLTESAALHEATGKTDVSGPVNSVLGWVSLMLRDVIGAQTAISRALRTRARVGAVPDSASSFDAAAELAYMRGATERALRLKGAADAIYERYGLKPSSVATASRGRWVADAHRSLGMAAASAWEAGRRLAFDEAVAEALGSLTNALPAQAGGASRLTAREMQIARLVATGMTNERIARRLRISTRTVDAHLDHMRTKLGVRSRVEIASWVTEGSGVTPL